MPNWTIKNGANQPINFQTGTVPDVSGALKDYFQYMTFTKVTKSVVAYQLSETKTDISFWGLITPFSERQLGLLPIGERAWTYFNLFAEPVLTLQVDDVVIWNGKQTRIMGRENFTLYGYVRYSLVQDWDNAGPPTP